MASGNWLLACVILTTSPCPAGVGAAADASAQAQSPAVAERLAVRLSWGHASDAPRTFHVALAPNTVAIESIRPDGFESGDTFSGGACDTRAGGGDVDALVAEVAWRQSRRPPSPPHSMWQHLLDHGEAGQVARLEDDPGLRPGAPAITVRTSADGTLGFSIGLEQLARHKAMWLPEHDLFVTLADAPVDFAAHLASLTGERVLNRVKREPDATLAEWTNRWADFGNPTRPHHGQESEWLGTRGHLTGFAAQHGSLYKFGVDRWASVRPDYASPHKFRFDPLWPDCQWRGQRIVDGLPVLVTGLERGGQRCEVEQFASTLRPNETVRPLTPSLSAAGGVGSRGAGERERGRLRSSSLPLSRTRMR